MFTVFLIAVGLAMDSFGASVVIGAGLDGKKTFGRIALISAAFAFFQAVMPLIGLFIGDTFSYLVSETDHWLAFLLLSAVGLKMIREGIAGSDRKSTADKIGFALVISLAFATSIDALIVGMGIAFLGTPIFLSVAVIGLVTLLMSLTGILLGSAKGRAVGRHAGIAGGGVLVLIGLRILLEHLS